MHIYIDVCVFSVFDIYIYVCLCIHTYICMPMYTHIILLHVHVVFCLCNATFMLGAGPESSSTGCCNRPGDLKTLSQRPSKPGEAPCSLTKSSCCAIDPQLNSYAAESSTQAEIREGPVPLWKPAQALRCHRCRRQAHRKQTSRPLAVIG